MPFRPDPSFYPSPRLGYASTMRYIERTPGPALSPWVDKLWALCDAPTHARERILPSGTFELVINLHEDELRIYDSIAATEPLRLKGATISGAYARSFVIDTREHAAVMGVHFKPGGVRPFLRVPASELQSSHVELEALWGASGRSLRERLCSAPDDTARFGLLEDALSQQLSRSLEGHAVVPWLIAQLSRGESVASLARELSMSHRRLIRVFADAVGVTPKLFARIIRFQCALRWSARPETRNWAELAASLGYCDQSHLIRDFVAFSGLSPSELSNSRGVPVKEHHIAVRGVSNFSNTRERTSS